MTAAPGGSSTRTVTARAGNGTQSSVGTPGNLACTVTSAATTCSDTTNVYTSAANALLNWSNAVSGVQAAATLSIGSVVTVP